MRMKLEDMDAFMNRMRASFGALQFTADRATISASMQRIEQHVDSLRYLLYENADEFTLMERICFWRPWPQVSQEQSNREHAPADV